MRKGQRKVRRVSFFSMRDSEKKNSPTQSLVQLSEVRDGIIVLADGTLRSILMVSSLNFALKSEEEQNAIVFAFQGFLNSLDFPVQITVMSRKLDITPYLEELRQRKNQQQNELLRLQMEEYSNFVAELVKGNDIMTKSFFVTVSFSVQQSKQTGVVGRVLKGLQSLRRTKKTAVTDEDFEHYRTQLLLRVEQVAIGLQGVGLRLMPLKTQEVLELFYDVLNPVTSRNHRLQNVAKLRFKETERGELRLGKENRTPWVKT